MKRKLLLIAALVVIGATCMALTQPGNIDKAKTFDFKAIRYIPTATTGAPTANAGTIFYDSTLGAFRGRLASSWITLGAVGESQVSNSATSVTLTSAYYGKTMTNSGATGPVTYTLPEASTCLGMTFTFVVMAVQNLVIDPADGTDKIELVTNAAGDSLTADAVGESIVLRAVANNSWAVIGSEKGTWTDTN
jgi:hypothetical protein